MERKIVNFEIKAVDQETGIIEGYAATFSDKPDAYGDVIDPGAFTKTLKENKDSIVSLFNHNIMEPIGLPELEQDEKGLHAKIRLVMELQKARDTLALARAGVVKRLSIGYDSIKTDYVNGFRHLKEVRLYDVSPVVFAANPAARIIAIKGTTTFDDLPLADRDREWDATAAERRVRAWAGGEDVNFDKYRRAFMWYAEDDPELLGSYKLGFADIIGGRLTAIPKGIFAIAAVLMGARGGVAIPEADKMKVKTHTSRYYKKMRDQFDDDTIIPPWDKAGGEPEETGVEHSDEEKSGRVLSAASLSKLKAALEALQALFESAELEEEPKSFTPPHSEASYEAAELDSVIAGLKSGFNEKEAERRIDGILTQIKLGGKSGQ